MINKYTYILLLTSVLLSSFTSGQNQNSTSDFELLTTKTQFEAGSHIVLKFTDSDAEKPLLYCSNSFGSTVVVPSMENNKLHYKIPASIASKKGMVNWKLLNNEASISGQLKIVSKQEVATMETYIGPPSIEAGGTDYTMLVVIPTDSLDNPLAENTLVNAKHQFLSNQKNEDIFTKNLIAFKNIYSQLESGRMLVSSESLNTNSKEFTINVTAAIPTDFTISAKRPHDYADGNQITTFTTSIIKDKLENVVSDGTFVNFFITNKKGNILRTSGTTISGVATARMIHPDYEEDWSVKAYVDGMAESNVLSLTYKQVIDDFEVRFSQNNRDVTVGPLQSFMNQMIPDGLQVKLTISKDNLQLETYSKTSYNGYVQFILKSDIFINDSYKISIKTAGLEKTFENTKLW
ncbi:MAG: hypothetical protein HKO81_06850 [Flavobacteriaceae bacterium]|nr:hypothetical protein [Flavobacteriaceae bacterium]